MERMERREGEARKTRRETSRHAHRAGPALETGLARRIATYAALGGAAAIAGEAHATVIYNDIPDVTLDTNGATFDLDFNGDALAEVTFRITKNHTPRPTYSGYSFPSDNSFQTNRAFADPGPNMDPVGGAPSPPFLLR